MCQWSAFLWRSAYTAMCAVIWLRWIENESTNKNIFLKFITKHSNTRTSYERKDHTFAIALEMLGTPEWTHKILLACCKNRLTRSNDLLYHSDSLIVVWNIFAIKPSPEVINFFMLNSTEHEISTAHKAKILTNKEVSCFMSLRCCIYHANKC